MNNKVEKIAKEIKELRNRENALIGYASKFNNFLKNLDAKNLKDDEKELLQLAKQHFDKIAKFTNPYSYSAPISKQQINKINNDIFDEKRLASIFWCMQNLNDLKQIIAKVEIKHTNQTVQNNMYRLKNELLNKD